MANVTLQGNAMETVGELPAPGADAPAFNLIKVDLSEAGLADFAGKTIVLNIFPSLDTPTCAQSVRSFNEKASQMDGTVVLCVSADLPFAQARFCGAEGLEDVVSLSTFRSPEFGSDYGVTFKNGPLVGLLSRAVVMVKDGKVTYTEQVAEITDEPNYDAALAAI